jgi:hypothetical protein
MKIAILYICTGKYLEFWNEFYESANKFLLTKHKKHYFVFTDSVTIKNSDSITIINTPNQGFPLNSLNRYNYFCSIENELSKFDYIYFFNSNIKFINHVNEEIFPDEIEHNGILGILHSGYVTKDLKFYPFERNNYSTAFIPYIKKSNYNYFTGAVNGGKSNKFIDLIKLLNKNILLDLNNNLIPIYHDESHYNKFLNTNRILILDENYCFPEISNYPNSVKILLIDKIKYSKSFKKRSTNIFFRINSILRKIISYYLWKY